MPFRLGDGQFRAKIQFVTSAEMPALIFKAVCATHKVSNTQYVQHAVCEALARDLDLDLDVLLAHLPPPRGKAAVPFGANRKPMPGAANTIETVR